LPPAIVTLSYGEPVISPDTLELRQCVLAVSVLHDIDVTPRDDGFALSLAGPTDLTWFRILRLVGDRDPGGEVARGRIANWLRLRRAVLDGGAPLVERWSAEVRMVALPREHADHPGLGWCRESFRGGVLERGLGVRGALEDPDAVTTLYPDVFEGFAPDPEELATRWWTTALEHAERMGALAAARLRRDGTGHGVIRPVGGCDVLTLLTTSAVRRLLADSDHTGMRAVAVPMRTRGWFDLTRIDPAFTGAAWTATDPFAQGLPRPLLITRDEVGMAREGGDPVREGLLEDPPDVAPERTPTVDLRADGRPQRPASGITWRRKQ